MADFEGRVRDHEVRGVKSYWLHRACGYMAASRAPAFVLTIAERDIAIMLEALHHST